MISTIIAALVCVALVVYLGRLFNDEEKLIDSIERIFPVGGERWKAKAQELKGEQGIMVIELAVVVAILLILAVVAVKLLVGA